MSSNDSTPLNALLLLLITTAICISQTSATSRRRTDRRRSSNCIGITKWGTWGSWSECQCTGTNETRSRSRTCNKASGTGCSNICAGSSTDSGSCSAACCDQGRDSWGAWGEYGLCLCNTTVSTDYKTRTRVCEPEHDWCNTTSCLTGESAESAECGEDCCNIPFADWDEAFKDINCTCNYVQGTGFKTRNTTCSGNDTGCKKDVCVQTKTETENCDDDCCKNVDGGYTNWDSACDCGSYNENATSGVSGYMKTNRSCTNPAPQCFGKACVGDATGTGDGCCCRSSFDDFSQWGDWFDGTNCDSINCGIDCDSDVCRCRTKTCAGAQSCSKCTDHNNGRSITGGTKVYDRNCTSSADRATLSVIFLIVSLIISDYR